MEKIKEAIKSVEESLGGGCVNVILTESEGHFVPSLLYVKDYFSSRGYECNYDKEWNGKEYYSRLNIFNNIK